MENNTFYPKNDMRNYLCHYGVKGMHWRNHRYADPSDRYKVGSRKMPSYRGITPPRKKPADNDYLTDYETSVVQRNNAKGVESGRKKPVDNDYLEDWEVARAQGRYPSGDSTRPRSKSTVQTGQKRRAQLDVEENHHGLASLKGKRLNKGQNATDIPGVDDKSIRSPILQRGNHSGRHQGLYKFGRTIADERRRGYRRPRAHNH